ncbi:MAG: FtsX-like permease family protein [Crocinitomicaceae bacterium]|nr:FtsX-like permease family protein [Crocinitomicaceae bacterium]
MNAVKLSWKNIKYRPWRSGLAVLLMASGLSIVIVLVLTQSQIDEKFKNNLAEIDLVVGAKGSPLQLVLSSVYHIDNPTGNIHEDSCEFIKNHPFVANTIPVCIGDNFRTYRIVGTTEEYLKMYEADFESGAVWNKPMQIVVGANVYEKYPNKLKVGKRITGGHGIGNDLLEEHNHAHDGTPYEIVGVLKPTGKVLDNMLLCDYRSTWIVHSGHDSGASFDLKTKNEVDESNQALQTFSNPDSAAIRVDTVPAENTDDAHNAHAGHDHSEHNHGHHDHNEPVINVDSILKTIPNSKREITALLVKYKNMRAQMFIPNAVNKNSSLIAADPDIERDRMLKLVDSGIQTANLMGYFVLIISAISVFIALFSSLKDRGYEIALIRVQGASRLKVFAMILGEGLMLSLLGYIFAILISHVGMWVVSGILESNYHYDFNPWAFSIMEVYLLGTALIIGLISALLPALKAYRTDISTTLSK